MGGSGEDPAVVDRAIEDLAVDFDYTDPETVEHLYEVYRVMRSRSGATHSSRYGGHWAVTRYDDIVAIAKDPKGWTSAAGVTIPEVGNVVRSIPLEIDPPEHTRYRQFLGPRFRRARVERMEPSIRRMVVGCLEAVLDRGGCDLVPALTERVPATVIADLLGLPEEDWETFRAWTTAMQRSAYDEDRTANAEAAEGLGGYLATAIERRRGGEDDGGVLWQLANGLVDGAPVPTDRALGMALLILMAGHETTASSASSALLHLADKPQLRTRLAGDPALVTAFVNEMLRYEAPVTGMARTATCPHRIDGQDIAEGDKILLLFSAGNRDERAYDRPDEFDLQRHGRPNLAFGWGAHRCLGELVARLELQVIIEEVLRLIPDYRLQEGATITHTPGIARGVTSLPVTWEPRHSLVADVRQPSP